MNRVDICINIIQFIKSYISDPFNLKQYHEKKHFSRKRKLSIFQVIMFLLYSSKASLSCNLSCIRDDLQALSFPTIPKQAFSKARQHISPSLFETFFQTSVTMFYSQIPSRKTWNGYHVFAIDGSKFELPNSKSNFDFFGCMSTHPNPDRKFTMALASMLYDVLDDYIIHASMNPYLASERECAREHLDKLKEFRFGKKCILIFDRGYYSEGMFRYCVDNGFLCVMRLKEGINFSKRCTGDSIEILPGNPKKDIPDLRVRIIQVILDNGTKEYLATNIFKKKFSPAMFKELYFKRWPVETKYKELKSPLASEEFSGATTTAVLQEFFINLLLSNLCSLVKNEADNEIRMNANPENKYEYQAKRSFIIGVMKKSFPKILCGILEVSRIKLIYEEAVRCKSQIIPERSFPRKKNKAIGRKHFNNKKAAF